MAPTRYHAGKFPPKTLDWPRLLPLVGPTAAAIARYEGVLKGVPNANVLLSPLTTQEAVLSSKIEGTQATFGEVLEYEARGGKEDGESKTADIQEVLNYRSALRHAVHLMKTLPLSQRVIKEAHRVLMDGVRGADKSPGNYRTIDNWIGPAGCSVKTARFVPPSPLLVKDAMAAWERHLHSQFLDNLAHLAVLHAEFESIHPFLDGNGRLGRLLVPLFLVEKKLLAEPNFYISEYLELHRDEYYERLLAVSRDGDWTGWCEFFLTAMLKQAKRNEAKASQILHLYSQKKDWITWLTHSQYAVQALDWFFSRPIFQSTDFVNTVGFPAPTAKRIIREVRKHGLLKEIHPGKGRRPAVLAFPELLNIAEGRTVF